MNDHVLGTSSLLGSNALRSHTYTPVFMPCLTTSPAQTPVTKIRPKPSRHSVELVRQHREHIGRLLQLQSLTASVKTQATKIANRSTELRSIFWDMTQKPTLLSTGRCDSTLTAVNATWIVDRIDCLRDVFVRDDKVSPQHKRPALQETG